MSHPFASVAGELKALQHKLNLDTYEALFGRTALDRQRAHANALTTKDTIAKLFDQTAELVDKVGAFMRGPANSGLLSSIEEFIELIEQQATSPTASKMSLGSQAATPPCSAFGGLVRPAV